MKTIMRNLMALVLMSGVGGLALADTPKSLVAPDVHSIMSKGSITLYRVQVQGMEMGPEGAVMDSEVFVTLDSDPSMVYTLRLHDDSPPVNTIIATTLREAFLSKSPVTLYHQLAPGKKVVKIRMVQMER